MAEMEREANGYYSEQDMSYMKDEDEMVELLTRSWTSAESVHEQVRDCEQVQGPATVLADRMGWKEERWRYRTQASAEGAGKAGYQK